jgi:hypothetical protein
VNGICEHKALEEKKACSSKYIELSGRNRRRKAQGERRMLIEIGRDRR